jgi:hypothetical protein
MIAKEENRKPNKERYVLCRSGGCELVPDVC